MKKIAFMLKLLTILVFLLLGARLFFLAVVKGKEYEQRSRENRIKIIFEAAPRGVVFDSRGEVLARNSPEGRKYPDLDLFSHIIGYLAEASEDDLAKKELRPKDLVGKSGLELEYDTQLRGQPAERLVETDTAGQTIREIGYKEAIPGQSLHLFIDKNLQKAAAEAMNGENGAIIISRPDGKILSLLSLPAFNPNLFTIKNETSPELLAGLFSDPAMPLFNRAVSGLYPPGSTFKMITAIAGLESGKISPDTTFEDTGQLCIGEWCFANWYYTQYGRTEGQVNLVKALQRSNDIFFYNVGQEVGIKSMGDWAKNFGLAQQTGLDLPGEEAGLFPSPEWKQEIKGEDWYLGDTIISSIGQGNILVTPIQINQMVSALANNGAWCKPQILAYSGDKESSVKAECRDLGIKQNYLDVIKSGMVKACEPGGTGWPFFNFGIGGESTVSAGFKKISIACKTGTAEIGDAENQTHAWFSLYAPAEKPEIVVTVLAEKAGEGSYEAAPTAKKILKYYFENE